MSGAPLPKNILDLINAAVTQAVNQTREAMEAEKPAPPRDYFRIMERLLYNYPALKRLVADKAGYTSVTLQGRSKSIVRQSFAASWKSSEDLQEELERDKEAAYDQTLQDFRRVERVIQLHKDRKEFIVVRMYYFGENAEGGSRGSEERCTFADVAADTGRDEKTLRRWRNQIVNDMAVCLFGIEAAVSSGTVRDA